MNDETTPTREAKSGRNGPYRDFSVRLPERGLRALQRIAAHRDMSCEALVREYISRGLIADGQRMFSETALLVAEEVLTDELGSREKAEVVLARIRDQLRA